MTDTQIYEKLLQIRACADLRTAEMLKDLISEFESRERSKNAPSRSVAALVKTFPASWKRHMKANTGRRSSMATPWSTTGRRSRWSPTDICSSVSRWRAWRSARRMSRILRLSVPSPHIGSWTAGR